MATLIPALSCQARRPRGCEVVKPSSSCLQPAHLPCAGRPRGLSPRSPRSRTPSEAGPGDPQGPSPPDSPSSPQRCVASDGPPTLARTWFLRYIGGFPSCGLGHASCKKATGGDRAHGIERSPAKKLKTRKKTEALVV